MTDLPASVRWQLWIVAFGFFMQSLDTTIVNTALPSMAKSLGESPLHMHMIIVSYVLTVAVMLPASGWLADRVGVRNIFFTAIVLFTAGSLFCAQANTLDQLVMARVLQGVGGAMMVPVGRLTVMKIVPRTQYMAAMTFVTLPGQVGPLLGPALGGILVEYASWHWIFLINLPVGIIGAIANSKSIPINSTPTVAVRKYKVLRFEIYIIGISVGPVRVSSKLAPGQCCGILQIERYIIGANWWISSHIFLCVQIHNSGKFHRSFAQPTGFLYIGCIYFYKVDIVQMHRISAIVHSPINFKTHFVVGRIVGVIIHIAPVESGQSPCRTILYGIFTQF